MSTFWRDRPTLVTGATGLVGGWVVRRLVEAGADVVCLVRDWVPDSELVRGKLIEQMTVVRGDVCDGALVERVWASTRSTRSSTWPRRRSSASPTATRSRPSRPTSRAPGRSSRRAAAARTVKQIVRRLVRQGVRRPGAAALRRDDAAAGPAPLRRQQVVRGPDRADLRRHLRPAGGDHALRQFLRRRRPELEPHRPGHDPLGAPRRAAGDPLRRPVRPRLLLRRGRRGRLHAAGRAAGRATRSCAGEAFNFSNEIQVTVLELVGKILAPDGAATWSPTCATRRRNEIRHQYLSAAKAGDVLDWRPLFTLDEGLAARPIAWYREFLCS